MSLWLPKRGLVLAKLSMDKNGIGACCCGGGGCERCTGAVGDISVALTFPAETWTGPFGPGCDLDENNGTYTGAHTDILNSLYWSGYFSYSESCEDTGGSNCCMWGFGETGVFPCEVSGFGWGFQVAITLDASTYYLEMALWAPFGLPPTSNNIHWTAAPVSIGTIGSPPTCASIDETLTLSYDGSGLWMFSDVTADITF